MLIVPPTPADVGEKPSRPNMPASPLSPSAETATTDPMPRQRK
jgi:hypothetical protein